MVIETQLAAKAVKKSAEVSLNLPTAVPAALPASLASGATLNAQSVTFADNQGGTPKALSITANNGVSITGGPFTTYGANSYNIVAPANNTAAAITATVTYSVTDNAGNVATATQTIDIAPALPATPTGLSFSGSVLSWNAVGGAASYTVVNTTASLTMCSGSNVTSCDVAGSGSRNTISVTAVNGTGSASAATILFP